jgi:uncharacterized protein
MKNTTPRYRTLSSWLKETFGEPVRKISVDAGLGCPNRDGVLGTTGCLYCNPRGSGTGVMARGESISTQIDKGIQFLSKRYGCRKFIAYFQSFTNTYGDVTRLSSIYAQAVQRPEIVGMAIGTRPDCVPDPVLNLLEGFAQDRLVWVEYGLQSIHDHTLDLIARGHGPDAFLDAVGRTRQRGISVVAHLILGLPGESLADMRETAIAVTDAGVDGVKLHPLYVIRGTGLEKMFLDGTYRPLTEEEALNAMLAVLEILPQRIVIHRITSDPHLEELIAPQWMLDRNGVRRRIQQAMEQRDFMQGSNQAGSRERGSGSKSNDSGNYKKSEAMPKKT